jgi:hypothetical protein
VRLLKPLTYRPEFIAVASWLGLRGTLRRAYYWWARPPDGILRLEVGGISAQFYARTPGELRNLDLGHELVEVVRGDECVQTENLPPPRLVKIDVEGCEYAVLRGLQRTLAHPACELVCCEIHPQLLPPDVKRQTIVNFMQSIGYGCLDLRPRFDTFHLLAWKAATCLHNN